MPITTNTLTMGVEGALTQAPASFGQICQHREGKASSSRAPFTF